MQTNLLMSNKQDDPRWAELCKKIDKRDRHDRLMDCVTPGEARIAKNLVKRLDRCHILARSARPDLIYNENNILKLNRTSHNRLDNCQCPLTGEPIARNVRNWWWYRLIEKTTVLYEENTDYQKLIESFICPV